MKIKSIRLKILGASGMGLILTAVFILAFSAATMLEMADKGIKESINNAEANVSILSRQFSNRIAGKLDEAMVAARTMAASFSGVKDENATVELERQEINNLLKTVLLRNTDFFAAFTCWEPDAFDGLDSGYTGAVETGHDQTGRLVPFWYRSDSGSVVVKACENYQTPGPGDYYQLPLKNRQEFLMPPVKRKFGQKEALTATLVAPILVGETFFGVAGFELDLSFFADEIENVKDFYDGMIRIAIIDNNRNLIAVTGNSSLVGKPLTELIPSAGAVLN
ncbi:MAG: cache domain-containing protein, partial [Candidatus Riflebacteria bacterium]